jgi:hypothetical protein
MAVLPMKVLADTAVTWGDQTAFQVCRGTIVAIDPANSALVAAYGGAPNLADMTGAAGDGSTLAGASN